MGKKESGFLKVKSKNYLKHTRCYLSGPIEHDVSKTNWRIEPSKILRKRYKINLFDPFTDPKQQWVPKLLKARKKNDFAMMEKIARRFVRKDLSMVDRADYVIAYLPAGVPTTGTHHEIINSNNAKKPTMIVCPEGAAWAPLWYRGFIPNQVIFGSWDELYAYLDEVHAGKHKKNNRWSFVYGLI